MSWRLALLLLACLAVAGCADSNKNSDNKPFGGWYGGATGGATP
jgi:hypothetical protein